MGIEDKWTTKQPLKGSYYDFQGGIKLNVVTDVRYMVPSKPSLIDPDQKWVNVNIINSKFGRPYVLFKRATLYEGDSRDGNTVPYDENDYESVAAHEFGHILNIGDSYAYSRNIPRGEAASNAEVPDDDIMRIVNGVINANTIEMLLMAQKSGGCWQSFDHDLVPQSEAIRYR